MTELGSKNSRLCTRGRGRQRRAALDGNPEVTGAWSWGPACEGRPPEVKMLLGKVQGGRRGSWATSTRACRVGLPGPQGATLRAYDKERAREGAHF